MVCGVIATSFKSSLYELLVHVQLIPRFTKYWISHVLQSLIQGGINDIRMTKCAHINTLDNHFLTTVSAISKLKIGTKTFNVLSKIH